MSVDEKLIEKAAKTLLEAKNAVVFTGAGISVESGIPPFRGQGGLWQKYNPIMLDLDFFHANYKEAWTEIHRLFYSFLGKAKANLAHEVIAKLEKRGIIKSVITQNIDHLHQEAGSSCVHEFHGTYKILECVSCKHDYRVEDIDLNKLPPHCKSCNSILKPKFVFFGEQIPQDVSDLSFQAARQCDVMLVIGTTGEVVPASIIPEVAKIEAGATIIEINPSPSNFTNSLTDIFLQDKAGIVMSKILEHIDKM